MTLSQLIRFELINQKELHDVCQQVRNKIYKIKQAGNMWGMKTSAKLLFNWSKNFTLSEFPYFQWHYFNPCCRLWDCFKILSHVVKHCLPCKRASGRPSSWYKTAASFPPEWKGSRWACGEFDFLSWRRRRRGRGSISVLQLGKRRKNWIHSCKSWNKFLSNVCFFRIRWYILNQDFHQHQCNSKTKLIQLTCPISPNGVAK